MRTLWRKIDVPMICERMKSLLKFQLNASKARSIVKSTLFFFSYDTGTIEIACKKQVLNIGINKMEARTINLLYCGGTFLQWLSTGTREFHWIWIRENSSFIPVKRALNISLRKKIISNTYGWLGLNIRVRVRVIMYIMFFFLNLAMIRYQNEYTRRALRPQYYYYTNIAGNIINKSLFVFGCA